MTRLEDLEKLRKENALLFKAVGFRVTPEVVAEMFMQQMYIGVTLDAMSQLLCERKYLDRTDLQLRCEQILNKFLKLKKEELNKKRIEVPGQQSILKPPLSTPKKPK